jgi:hypothetical protein
MPTDLEQQLARFAEALDREAPTISFDDMVGRGTLAVDLDLLERPSSDRASRVNGVPWIDTMPSHEEIGEPDVLIELAPALVVRRPAWRRVSLKVALGVAAAAVLVVTLAAIERDGNETDPADDVPNLTTTFVSPRNGYSIQLPDAAAVTPADQIWFGDQLDGFDVVETGSNTVFKGMSTELPSHYPCTDTENEPIPCGSIDAQIDQLLPDDLPGSCGVPRSQQTEITIDGQSGRIAECPNHIEATVVFDGNLYVFTLSHDRSDARAVFDAFAATIDLTPETAIRFPAMMMPFVSPTNGFSFKYIGGLAPATELWDPVIDPPTDTSGAHDGPFDGVETAKGAYFKAASTEIPDGVAIDAWVDEYVSPGGCSVPRSQQAEITIDGQAGKIAECAERVEATVVAGGRLYFFLLLHSRSDARAFFDAWVATIDLTPETATVP